jgi:hypothetical protein
VFTASAAAFKPLLFLIIHNESKDGAATRRKKMMLSKKKGAVKIAGSAGVWLPSQLEFETLQLIVTLYR